jgi:hypothetical protein
VFDLLEKGMREPDENDWMLAYSLEGHPELHLSHHYFRGLSEEQAQHIVGKLKEHFAQKPLQAKPIQINQVENFGPEQDIRVLVNDKLAPHLDPELKQQMEAIHPSRFPTYRPHVTSQHHNDINSKISGYYFQRGNGQTYFSTSPSVSESSQNMSDSTNEPLDKAAGMPKVNAKVEGIEVKRPMTGVAGQKTSVSTPAMPPPPKVGVPPKLGAQTGKMNNMPSPQGAPLQKTDSATWLASQQKNKPAAAPKEAPALDYSTFKRPTYATSGSVKPLHNPIQHSQGALTGMDKQMNKAEGSTLKDKFERCIMHVKAKNKTEGKTLEEKNPWAICHASLNKADKNVNIGGHDYEYSHDNGVVSYHHTGDEGMTNHAHVSNSKSAFKNQNTFKGHPANHQKEFQEHADTITTSLHKNQNECNTPEYIVKSESKLSKLRKCMALKKDMPVFQRD